MIRDTTRDKERCPLDVQWLTRGDDFQLQRGSIGSRLRKVRREETVVRDLTTATMTSPPWEDTFSSFQIFPGCIYGQDKLETFSPFSFTPNVSSFQLVAVNKAPLCRDQSLANRRYLRPAKTSTWVYWKVQFFHSTL